MPKLKNLHFEKENNAGEIYTFHTDMYVTTQGEFWATIPFELWEIKSSYKGEDVRFVSSKDKKQIYSNKADSVNQAISALIDCYLECEESTCKVIVYEAINNYSIWECASGTLYPSGGSDQERSDNASRWRGNLNATNRAAVFSVGLTAFVVDKTTYISKSGNSTRVKYSHSSWIGDHLGPYATYHDKLKSFVGLKGCIDFHGNLVSGLKEIPYSEDAARFFYDALLALCMLALKMERFFEDDQKLLESLKNNEILMLEVK